LQNSGIVLITPKCVVHSSLFERGGDSTGMGELHYILCILWGTCSDQGSVR